MVRMLVTSFDDHLVLFVAVNGNLDDPTFLQTRSVILKPLAVQLNVTFVEILTVAGPGSFKNAGRFTTANNIIHTVYTYTYYSYMHIYVCICLYILELSKLALLAEQLTPMNMEFVILLW